MTDSPGDSDGNSSLWILFFSLFVILLLITFFAICHGCLGFCGRYCVYSGRCCPCSLDLQAYRREQESLRRLRELRRRQRRLSTFTQIPGAAGDTTTQATRTNAQGERLSTFSQIPGAIPDAAATLAQAYGALGFILVPTSASTSDASSFANRHALTMEQRRRVLNQVLVCKEYHHIDDKVQEKDEKESVGEADTGESCTIEKDDTDEAVPEAKVQQHQQVQDDNNDDKAAKSLEEGQQQNKMALPEQNQVSTLATSLQSSFAFPYHEEPAEPETTCAICLDLFVEGDLINDASSDKCPHTFHKACLLEWLDRHDVCPCCRRPMITDAEWRQAILDSHVHLASTTGNMDDLREQLQANGSNHFIVHIPAAATTATTQAVTTVVPTTTTTLGPSAV